MQLIANINLLRSVIRPSTVRAGVYVAAFATVASVFHAFQPFVLARATVAVAQGADRLAILAAYVGIGLISGICSGSANFFALRSRERIGGDIALATLAALVRPDRSFSHDDVAESTDKMLSW